MELVELPEAVFPPAFVFSKFTLNNIISDALAENRKLQKICIHNFVDGYCEYCDMEENND